MLNYSFCKWASIIYFVTVGEQVLANSVFIEPQIDCGIGTLDQVTTSGEKLYSPEHGSEISRLMYKRTERNSTSNNTVEVDTLPKVALRVPLGWLVGSSRGEWGGEAVFLSSDRKITSLLIRDNIEDIYKISAGYIITAGLSHLSLNSGDVYLVTFSVDNKPDAKRLFSLPGTPTSSWELSPNHILINTENASFLLDSNLSLRRVTCKGMKYREPMSPADINYPMFK
jgi:hypothetical protein